MQRDNAVVFLASGMDACAMWRLWVTHYNFPGSRFYCFRDRPNFEVIAGKDICVVQRLCTKAQWEFLQVVKKLGLKLIYDLDDDMWNVPKENPAYPNLMHYKMGFIECMKIVDAITVSTKHLAKIVAQQMKKYGDRHIPIIVVENRVDEKIFAPVTKKDQMIVGWAGSTSHIGDLGVVLDGLLEVAIEETDVQFEFRGLEPPVALQELSNVTFKLWTPVSEFVSRMPQWGWSVGLAPLTDHIFNESKSCIKVLESAYCRIPCLCSWVDQYDRFCSYDSELRWLLCAGKGNWAPKLRELLHDGARREELGERAYQVMKTYYSYSKPHEQWRQAFDAVLGSKPTPSGFTLSKG